VNPDIFVLSFTTIQTATRIFSDNISWAVVIIAIRSRNVMAFVANGAPDGCRVRGIGLQGGKARFNAKVTTHDAHRNARFFAAMRR
jgi:hypothetical protein